MPNYSSPDPAALDRAFHALGDATRRGVIAQLTLGAAARPERAAASYGPF